MESKKVLGLMAVLFVIMNGYIVLAANEPQKNFFSSGVENPDSDYDGVDDRKDKCLGTPYNIIVLNKFSKTEKAQLSLKNGYLRLKKFNSGKNPTVVFESSSSEAFDKDTKSYTIELNKITALDGLKKRVKILYSNSKKGFVVMWTADAESKERTGCVEGEGFEA